MDGTDGAYYNDNQILVYFGRDVYDTIQGDDCTYVAEKYLAGRPISFPCFLTIRDLMLAGF